MNPNVPPGAAVLLDYIGRLETGRQGDAAYQAVIAHLNEKGELPKPLTDMTLTELLAEQLRWVRSLKQPSGAAGRYQIIRPTLLGLMKQYPSAAPSAKFTPNLQDAFGYALLKRRGYDGFMAGTLSLKDYGNELAKEWASLPVLSTVKRSVSRARMKALQATLAKARSALEAAGTAGTRAKAQAQVDAAEKAIADAQFVQRGQSYYDAVAGNKSLDNAMSFETVLSEALNERDRAPASKPEPNTNDFPIKGTMNNEVVAQVQRRLKELGYTEIGNVDGDFGDLTENAILIFRHDADLPVNGTIDEALIVALTKAPPRSMPAARQEAPPEVVREIVPEAKTNWLTKVVGFWTAAGSFVLAFVNWLFGSVSEVRATVKPVADLFGAIPVWAYALIFIAGGVWLYLNGRKGEQASVAAVQEGARR